MDDILRPTLVTSLQMERIVQVGVSVRYKGTEVRSLSAECAGGRGMGTYHGAHSERYLDAVFVHDSVFNLNYRSVVRMGGRVQG